MTYSYTMVTNSEIKGTETRKYNFFCLKKKLGDKTSRGNKLRN